MRILITGGAGFVGSSLALAFHARGRDVSVVALDNLRRRGSERNVRILERRGIRFEHGDVRSPSDLEDLDGHFDWVIDASAEPSVHAGVDGSPAYVIDTNLRGTLNCLEFCRRRAGGLIFLSTSRVYSIAPLRELPLRDAPTRFEPEPGALPAGVSEYGIDERFPTHLPRSYYGASKLASELLIQEYARGAGLRAVIDRCGVIAGPGQFGKVDQGVFTLWVARHLFRQPLAYTGFGGEGRQVRDLLHPADLFELLCRQMESADAHPGAVFNVGGGAENAVSLREYTAVCRDVTGVEIEPSSDPQTADVDVPWYVSDARAASAAFDWKPRRDVRTIALEILDWLKNDEAELRRLFVSEGTA